MIELRVQKTRLSLTLEKGWTLVNPNCSYPASIQSRNYIGVSSYVAFFSGISLVLIYRVTCISVYNIFVGADHAANPSSCR